MLLSRQKQRKQKSMKRAQGKRDVSHVVRMLSSRMSCHFSCCRQHELRLMEVATTHIIFSLDGQAARGKMSMKEIKSGCGSAIIIQNVLDFFICLVKKKNWCIGYEGDPFQQELVS